MFDTASASNGVKFALLESQLFTRESTARLSSSVPQTWGSPAIGDAADKFMAIAHSSLAISAALRPAR
jgi:hypothetical protein